MKVGSRDDAQITKGDLAFLNSRGTDLGIIFRAVSRVAKSW